MILLILCVWLTIGHQAYIDRFTETAIAEQSKYGIPASITLAQGILETGGGQSLGFKKYNNSFGMQCKRRKHRGECVWYNDAGAWVRLRKFKTAWDSFRAHSIHITTGRYADMMTVCGSDPDVWAQELQRRGYSTAPDYGDRLIRVMNDYNLRQYDAQ